MSGVEWPHCDARSRTLAGVDWMDGCEALFSPIGALGGSDEGVDANRSASVSVGYDTLGSCGFVALRKCCWA